MDVSPENYLFYLLKSREGSVLRREAEFGSLKESHSLNPLAKQ